jgi:hypothetical protein
MGGLAGFLDQSNMLEFQKLQGSGNHQEQK